MMAFVPSQVRAKETTSKGLQQTELSRFLSNHFRPTVYDNVYEPHRYLVDLVHCEPPRLLLGSNEDDENGAAKLFRPEPAIIRALARQGKSIEIKPVNDTPQALFQHVPEFKAVARKTFLDDTDEDYDETTIIPPPSKDKLFEIDEKLVVEDGGLFGFTMDLPELSRVGRINENTADVRLDDDLMDEDDEDDDRDFEGKPTAGKRQKLHEADKRLDREVESFVKRTEEK